MAEDTKTQKGVYIVYDDQELEYAKALQNLIGQSIGYYAVKYTERKFIKLRFLGKIGRTLECLQE